MKFTGNPKKAKKKAKKLAKKSEPKGTKGVLYSLACNYMYMYILYVVLYG